MRVGSFIKTGSPQVVELLGLAGLDFAIVDAEHAPFDRGSLDFMMLAGRAAGLKLFVRIPDDRPTTILQTLDLGAFGLVVPHVDSAAQAQAVVCRARFENGERGFSNSARFGHYGQTTIDEAIALGDASEIICQIESLEAVEEAGVIASTPGVAGLLVGRADLALSMGLRSVEAEAVLIATRKALSAARQHGKAAGVVIGDVEDLPRWLDAGATFFVIGTDQGLLRSAAARMKGRAGDLITKFASQEGGR